ncbi:hypothetical protein BH09SUM1_BH09SUM1_16560 [soil metagenome]
MEFKDELTEILKRYFVDPKIDLEVTSAGKVGGVLVSHTFDNVDQLKRQDFLWSFLEKDLPKEKQRKIIAILTMTPDEAGLPA